MTRITEQMLFTSMRSSLGQSQSRIFEAQQQMQTGVQVQRSSDAPMRADRGSLLLSAQRRLDGMQQSAENADHMLRSAEISLDDATDILMRVHEIAIAGGSDTYNADDRNIQAQEIAHLRDSLLALANTEVDGKSLFAGFISDQPAFDVNGIYQGDGGVAEVEVMPGVTVERNILGSSVFTTTAGDNTFTVLATLQDALERNDGTGIRATLDTIGEATNALVQGHAETGARRAVLERHADRRSELHLELESERQGAIGVSLMDAEINYLEAQSSLEAAVKQASAMLRQMGTLLDI